VGSSRARMDWFSLLREVILRDSLVRVRHQLFDEPVLLLRESTFRRVERDSRGEGAGGATGGG